MLKKTLFVAVLCTCLLGTAGVAGADPNQDVFDRNDNTWACEEEGNVPPAHCINVRSQGNTGIIHVFNPDPRAPQESFSTDPKSDTRPCPHDPDADPDGTWWSPEPGLWVCHHRP
jgi:hypothetical protein